ncbi:hypothetical protein GCM10019017_22440 [Streptomyces showdoensis]
MPASDAALEATSAAGIAFRDAHHQDFVHVQHQGPAADDRPYAVAGAHNGLVTSGTDPRRRPVPALTKYGDGAPTSSATGLTQAPGPRRVRQLGAPASCLETPTADLETLDPAKPYEKRPRRDLRRESTTSLRASRSRGRLPPPTSRAATSLTLTTSAGYPSPPDPPCAAALEHQPRPRTNRNSQVPTFRQPDSSSTDTHASSPLDPLRPRRERIEIPNVREVYAGDRAAGATLPCWLPYAGPLPAPGASIGAPGLARPAVRELLAPRAPHH